MLVEQSGNSVAHLKRLEPRVSTRAVAGLMSVALHLGLFLLIAFAGGRQDGVHDGDTPITQVVMLESPIADHRDGVELTPLEPAVPALHVRKEPVAQTGQAESVSIPDIDARPIGVDDTPPVAVLAPNDTALTSAIDPLSTLVMPQAQTSTLLQRIERLAEKVTTAPHAQVTWNQDGEQYNADLVLERARNGVEPDRVIAEVSAASRGRQLRTRILLRRLPFSYYTQIVDRWDPMIQLHDDEIVGRMHINSRFNVLDDSQATPQFLGKVTTAAVGFNMRSTGRGLGSDVFREGIETRAERVALSERVRPYEWGLRDVNARVHKLAHDTDIRFYADGSYAWSDHKSGAAQYRNEPTEQTVYFVAARGATLRVKGVAAGKFLIYSPHSIVLEGSLTYAHDPRNTPDSADYLGLVCDREIEVAPADVTGPGDVIIHAAIFARHRFVVTDTDQPTSATLRIYGSLAAGSLTASEPRYAMQVEYDSRFERFRPPGFPSTNRFAAEDWDGRWTEVPEQSTANTL